jgi:outer membrane protein assembly factor BamB
LAALLIPLLLALPASSTRAGEGEVALLTDEAIPRYLSRGQQLARSGEWAKMIDILQRVIEGDATIFPELDKQTLHSAVHTSDGVLYYPARELCVRELSRLPPEALTVYRTTYDVRAEEIYKAAQEADDLDRRLAGLTKVFDTYLVSSFGDDALDTAADLNLQLGRYYEALALYRRLIEVYPRDSDRDLVMAQTKAAYCAARIGDRASRDRMLERLVGENPGRRILVEGKPLAVEDLAASEAMTVIGGVSLGGTEDWTVAGGSPARHRVAEDLPEDLPAEPFWSFGLQERDSSFIAINGYWDVLLHDRARSVAPAAPAELIAVANYPTVRPVVHQGIVFYKDYVEVVSRNAASGDMRYIVSREGVPGKARTRDRVKMPVLHVRPGTGLGDPTDGSRLEAVYRWYDYGGNDLVVTDDHIVVTETRAPPRHLLTNRAGGGARPNLLGVLRRDNGKLIWSFDPSGDGCAIVTRRDPARLAAWKNDHRMHQFAYFRGPGAVSGGILYTIAEEKDGPKDQTGGVAVWAFRLSDGRSLFRTQLHHHDEVRTQLPGSASLAVAGTVVYVTTNAGILAAVDALPPGRIRWIRRYERGFSARGRGTQRRIHTRFAHNEPVVAAGKVIVATPDSRFIEAVDAETGGFAWRLSTAKLGDVHHIVGVEGQKLILAGSGICAVDIQSGKIVWSHEHLAKTPTWPYGRGFVSGKMAYVPSASFPKAMRGGKSYIHRFDLETGKRMGKFTFDVPRLGNIVCVGGRLIAANEESIMCFTTAEREKKHLDTLIAKRGERSEYLLDRALVSLREDPPKRAEAVEDMRRALGAAKANGEDLSEIRWRLIDLLLDKAQAEQKTDGLAEARELAISLLPRQKRTPPEKRRHPYEAQIALLETEILARTRHANEAVRTLEQFVDKYPDEVVVLGDRVVSVREAARDVRDRFLKNAEFRAAFETSVRARIEAAYKARSAAALAAIPAYYGNQPPAEEAFFALAKLHRESGELSKAELALRSILREFPSHPRRAEAHLQLALVLAERKLLYDARRERDQGLALLDEAGRKQHAEVVAQLGKLLPEAIRARNVRKLELPLRTFVLGPKLLQPIPLEGEPPANAAPFTLVTDRSSYIAIGTDGKTLWSAPMPSGGSIAVGNAENAGTTAVAAAIAHARLARLVEGDVLIADVHGMTRIEASTGKTLWSRPHNLKEAADSANSAVNKLRVSLETLAQDGHLNRASWLPAYVVRDDTIVRVDPKRGVAAFTLTAGDRIWEDATATGALSGAPSLVGQLLAVGRAAPGQVEIFDVVAGTRVQTIKAPHGERMGRDPGVLLSAPVLDRLGRLYLIAGTDTTAKSAAFHVLDTRNGKPLLKDPIPVHSRYATVLHADGTLAVFHDGSSGGDNLHFLELAANRHQRVPTEDMGREVHVVRDGERLFVLTYKAGIADEGARLFRIDLAGRASLRYQRVAQATAYARPILTRRYLVVAGSDGLQAHVRLYDREASKDMSPPSAVFPLPGGRKMTETLAFEPEEAGKARFDIPPAVAVSRLADADQNGLVLSHPFGAFRLQAAAPR